MRTTRTDFTAAFMRSFVIQGSWNYRTMIGAGLGFALSPLLQRIHAGDPVTLRRAIERHTNSFNAHPYLATVAIGALARLERDGEDAETIERFRTALRGPLGALGDQAVWAAWRPLCVLSTILAFCLGLDPRLAALAFLVVYNVGHIGLRYWGLKVGWRAGLEVGRVLNASFLRNFAARLTRVNEALVGSALVLVIARTPGVEIGPSEAGLVGAAALAGFFVPTRGGGVAIALMFVALGLWWI
ncbi:MAG: PTS system mannose/fructose/sorbose family transporter subunit IID [Gemmatimonadota bacterium]|nr:PTS system mannose/fructose/sorbose family transporter subunit IID [Gemmatimonadota bacterium]